MLWPATTAGLCRIGVALLWSEVRPDVGVLSVTGVSDSSDSLAVVVLVTKGPRAGLPGFHGQH